LYAAKRAGAAATFCMRGVKRKCDVACAQTNKKAQLRSKQMAGAAGSARKKKEGGKKEMQGSVRVETPGLAQVWTVRGNARTRSSVDRDAFMCVT